MSDDVTSDCAYFIKQINHAFAQFFNRYGFAFCGCDCQRDGRQCVAMFQSAQQSLLLHLSDGSFVVLLGLRALPFPGSNGVDRGGIHGWYALFLLAEFVSGKKVYTKKIVQKIWNGELDPYRFQADLLAEWADRLLPLFAPDHDPAWQAAFQQRFNQR